MLNFNEINENLDYNLPENGQDITVNDGVIGRNDAKNDTTIPARLEDSLKELQEFKEKQS